ncbi:hypothetical protein EGY16_13325 [Burkholderia pseudomallei]|nr:hypothetical protein EGY16_13325 [Burkholderia pseudomallei]
MQPVFSSEQISSSSGASPSRAGQSSDVAFYARRRRTRSKAVAVSWRPAFRPFDHRPSGFGLRAFCRLAT